MTIFGGGGISDIKGNFMIYEVDCPTVQHFTSQEPHSNAESHSADIVRNKHEAGIHNMA
jgi:hypothetical protein